jgi:hypothetical protein
MSDLIFPTLRGLQYPIKKTPHWNTLQNQTVVGVKKFVSLYTYPYYEFALSFSYLSDENKESDDIHTLGAFYNNVGGAGKDFLFADPLFEPNDVTDQIFATGNGTSKEFRLLRSYGGFIEPVFGVIGTAIITVNGTVVNDVSVSDKGLVTFASAPADGSIIKWSGRWAYRCHFKEDSAELEQIFYGGWSLEEIVLESIKLE